MFFSIEISKSNNFICSYMDKCEFFVFLFINIFLNFFLWLGVSEGLAPIPVFCIVIPINFLLVRFVFKSKQFEK